MVIVGYAGLAFPPCHGAINEYVTIETAIGSQPFDSLSGLKIRRLSWPQAGLRAYFRKREYRKIDKGRVSSDADR